jgi:hypothetical protein
MASAAPDNGAIPIQARQLRPLTTGRHWWDNAARLLQPFSLIALANAPALRLL